MDPNSNTAITNFLARELPPTLEASPEIRQACIHEKLAEFKEAAGRRYRFPNIAGSQPSSDHSISECYLSGGELARAAELFDRAGTFEKAKGIFEESKGLPQRAAGSFKSARDCFKKAANTYASLDQYNEGAFILTRERLYEELAYFLH